MGHVATPGAALPRQNEELVGAIEGQSAEERGMDEGKSNGIDTYAESQGDDGRRRKPAFFEQEAEREAQVLEHGG